MKIICERLYYLHTNIFSIRSSLTLRPLQDKTVMIKTEKVHSMMGNTDITATNQRTERLSNPEVLHHNKELREICQG